jgi:prepilin-type N-terminal cleavage/methylation domain-containing protein
MIHEPGARTGREEEGFSLFEMLLTLSVFSIIFTSLFMLVHGVQTSYDRGNTESVLRESGRRILKQMIEDLRETGILNEEPVNLPAVYEHEIQPMGDDNVRGPLIATMSFEDADLGGEEFRGPSRVLTHVDRTPNEIVFRRLKFNTVSLPDGRDIDLPIDPDTGELDWSDEELSFYVVRDASGTPVLIKQSSSGDVSILGRDVEKVVFDVISYDPTVLYNQIVIVLYMTKSIANGETIRVGIEGTVNLRNTRELEG